MNDGLFANLHPLDLAIVALYLCATVLIGWFAVRKPAQNLESYFLGDRRLPWYLLGVSNASGMFDVTGTIWLVAMMFVYGLKSVWFPWIWPIFNQIFLMVYMSRWLRRSNVMTGAEWIHFRFGENRGATLSHFTVVLFSLISVVGFLAYGFKGMGMFVSTFLPYRFFDNPAWNETACVAIFSLFTTFYVLKGGLVSVVYTELAQYLVLTIAALTIGVVAVNKVSTAVIAENTPAGWDNIWFGWQLNLDWSGILDAANKNIETDGFSMFTMVFTMMVIKGILVSAAGPGPNYDMQRLLASKSPKEASKISFFVSVVLQFPRYVMITGLAILAIAFHLPDMRLLGDSVDFDSILPYTLKHFIPVGLLGLILTGLLSAYMSNLAATVHAAPVYLINDVYKKYLRPNEPQPHYVRMSRWATLLLILVGIAFSFYVRSINTATQWIVAAFYGGYTAANVLKWYWWRFNAYGYFWGMLCGIMSSLILPFLLPTLSSLDAFPIILALSMTACFIASLLTPMDDIEVLKNFYRTVRPWGFWQPIHEAVVLETPGFKANMDFSRDLFNICIGVVWQICLIATPVFLVLRLWPGFGTACALLLATSVVLKYSWWDRMGEDQSY